METKYDYWGRSEMIEELYKRNYEGDCIEDMGEMELIEALVLTEQ
jgi:hypothetical protein